MPLFWRNLTHLGSKHACIHVGMSHFSIVRSFAACLKYYQRTASSHVGRETWSLMTTLWNPTVGSSFGALVITTEDDSFTDKRAMILVMGQRKLICILPVVVRGQALACDLSKASPELRPFSSSFPPHSNKGGTWEPCTITRRDQGIKRNREESMEWPHRFQNLSSPRNLDSKLSKWNQIRWE